MFSFWNRDIYELIRGEKFNKAYCTAKQKKNTYNFVYHRGNIELRFNDLKKYLQILSMYTYVYRKT